MRNLLKTDLQRVLKDKLFIALCIIAGAFAFVGPVLYKLLFSALNAEELLSMLGMEVNGKMLFFNAFKPGDNFGLVAPILIAIILCKDFSHGTIRNKIICGKSRTSVFLSLFTTAWIYICGIILAHALLTLLLSLMFFEYQATAFTWKDLGYLLLSIGFEILVFSFIAALIIFLCVSMRKAGLVIVLYIAVVFFFAIVGGVTMIAEQFSTPDTSAAKLLEIFNKINIFSSTLIGGSTSYSISDLLYIILPPVLGTALFGWLGLKIFKKKDLK